MEGGLDEIWTCRDGRQIPVGELTEAHAKSILRMILRNNRIKRELRSALNAIAKSEEPYWGHDT